MIDVGQLKDKIAAQGSTQEALANDIGINKSTLYRKLKDGGGTFAVWELQQIVKSLDLTEAEVNAIFFGVYSA